MVTFTRMPLFTRGYWSEVSRTTALLRRETMRSAVLCWLRPWWSTGRSLIMAPVDFAGNGRAADRLSYLFGAYRAVLDVASVVLPGQLQLVVGLNGAGKTRLMRVLLGMLRPDKGGAFVLGRDVSRNTSDSWRRVGHMVSAPRGYPKLTAEAFEVAPGQNCETPPERAV